MLDRPQAEFADLLADAPIDDDRRSLLLRGDADALDGLRIFRIVELPGNAEEIGQVEMASHDIAGKEIPLRARKRAVLGIEGNEGLCRRPGQIIIANEIDFVSPAVGRPVLPVKDDIVADIEPAGVGIVRLVQATGEAPVVQRTSDLDVQQPPCASSPVLDPTAATIAARPPTEPLKLPVCVVSKKLRRALSLPSSTSAVL